MIGGVKQSKQYSIGGELNYLHIASDVLSVHQQHIGRADDLLQSEQR